LVIQPIRLGRLLDIYDLHNKRMQPTAKSCG
jgi:hypothetical protein